MRLLLDAGAFIALARNERAVWRRFKVAAQDGEPPLTHAAVVGQVWRGSPRDARLSMALAGTEVLPIDERLGRAAGNLLGITDSADVIDAALVLLAQDGDHIVTSDRRDFEILASASGAHVELVAP